MIKNKYDKYHLKEENGANWFLKKIFLIFFLVIFVLSYFNGWRNYSGTLRTIAIPMKENVSSFYKENKRYPTLKETKLLLISSGCTSTKEAWSELDDEDEKRVSNICKFKYFMKMSVYTEISSRYNSYRLIFRIINSHCEIQFKKSGKSAKLKCKQDSFIDDIIPNSVGA